MESELGDFTTYLADLKENVIYIVRKVWSIFVVQEAVGKEVTILLRLKQRKITQTDTQQKPNTQTKYVLYAKWRTIQNTKFPR